MGLSGSGGAVEIAGGDEVAMCAWPSAVRMHGNCTGTLIHPQVVLYAGHCNTVSTAVLLGETKGGGIPQPVDECWVSPDYDGSSATDFAVCRLVDPVPDVPIIPILMGCEEQVLAVGSQVTTVGYGFSPEGPMGIKRAVTYEVVDLDWEVGSVAVGGGTMGTVCSGDSGGGSFVQLPDGSWRLFGVTSSILGEACGTGIGLLGLASRAVPWVESITGFDVTPCHDDQGVWDPGPDCTGIPIEPEVGGGVWPACSWGLVTGPVATCGVPFGGEDAEAPQVSVFSPVQGPAYAVEFGGTVEVPVVFEVDDGTGFGVSRVWLRLDGKVVPETHDEFPPWELPDLEFAEGLHAVEVVAQDWAGNVGVSEEVVVIVTAVSDGGSTSDGRVPQDDTAGPQLPPIPPLPTWGSEEGGGEHDGSGTTTTSGGGADGSSSGCGCRQRPGDGLGPAVLGLWMLLGARRRRR